jgi:hypothetical protein
MAGIIGNNRDRKPYPITASGAKSALRAQIRPPLGFNWLQQFY